VDGQALPFEETITLTLAEMRDTVYKTYRYRFLTLEETEEGFYLTALRTDHGVGMSQRGAEQRARAGQTYFEILDFYYEEAKIGHRHETDEERPKDIPAEIAYQGRVTADALNVRSGPGIAYDAIGQLLKDTAADVIERGEGWSLISAGGLRGYVSKTYLSPILIMTYEEKITLREAPLPPAVIPEKLSLHMRGRVIRKALWRKTPDTMKDAKPLGTLSEQTQVWILGAEKGYFRLFYENKIGYISKKAVVLEF
jgi:hypothetical protein